MCNKINQENRSVDNVHDQRCWWLNRKQNIQVIQVAANNNCVWQIAPQLPKHPR